MYLIITFDENAYFFPYIKSNENVVAEALESNSKVWKLIRRIPLISGFAFSSRLKYYAKMAEKIIIFDSVYTASLGKYLAKYNDKVVLYIWNPVNKTALGDEKKWIETAKRYSKVYSFDSFDSLKYEINLTSMIYSSRVPLNKKKVQYDVCFLGAGKGREEEILRLEDTVFRNVERCRFVIVGEEKNNTNKTEFSSKRYMYEDYLDLIAQSVALLDIPQIGQTGNTIRVMESLFFKKKLFTTNCTIRQNDFYDSQNIFVIGEDNEDEILDFLNSPYKEISTDIIRKYDFDYWKRFL